MALALSHEGIAFVHELHRLSHEEGVVGPSGDYGNASRAQEQVDGGKELLELGFEVRLAAAPWEVVKSVCDRAAASFWHAFLNKEHQREWGGAILACETQVHVAEGLEPQRLDSVRDQLGWLQREGTPEEAEHVHAQCCCNR